VLIFTIKTAINPLSVQTTDSDFMESNSFSGKLCQRTFGINLSHCTSIFFTDKNIAENAVAFSSFC